MTDEELDALDEVYDTMMEVQRNPAGAWQAIQDQAYTITTLRAQLADEMAEVDALTHTVVCLSEWLAEANARAERAEAERDAARAAQIEADALLVEGYLDMWDDRNINGSSLRLVAAAIRAQLTTPK